MVASFLLMVNTVSLAFYTYKDNPVDYEKNDEEEEMICLKSEEL